MWPFKSNIPEIKNMSEDEEGNIEINHSHGQFKINRKDIVEFQLTKKISWFIEKKETILYPWNVLFKLIMKEVHDFKKNKKIFEIILMGLPIAFGIWNFLIYNKINSNPQFFKYYRKFDLIAFNFTASAFDIIINLVLFLIISFICGFLIIYPLIQYLENISSKNNIVKIKTVGNEFTYRFNEEFVLTFFKEQTHLNTNPRYISPEYSREYRNQRANKKLSLFLGLILFSIPFISFIFNFDKPFWFYHFFEKNVNYVDYFLGDPKGFFELFFDGLASFGGTFLLLLLILLSGLLIIFFILLIFLIQIIILPFIITFYLLKFTNKRMKDFFNNHKLFPFDMNYSSNFIIFFPLAILISNLDYTLKSKSSFKNIIILTMCIVISIIVGVCFDFFLRDLIYWPLQDIIIGLKLFFYSDKIGASYVQFEKTIYFSLILFSSYFTLCLIIPKKIWIETINLLDAEIVRDNLDKT